MFFAQTPCPLCRYGGVVAFRRCSDSRTIVLSCDECGATWLDPQDIAAESALAPRAPDFIIPGTVVSLKGSDAGWASKDEIEKMGWSNFVVGEEH